MRKMTQSQAREYILAGYFPGILCGKTVTRIPISESDYIKEINEIRSIFNRFHSAFCASLIAEEAYAENALILFGMIWEDEVIQELQNLSIPIKENRRMRYKLYNRYSIMIRELPKISTKIDELDSEYYRLIQES